MIPSGADFIGFSEIFVFINDVLLAIGFKNLIM